MVKSYQITSHDIHILANRQYSPCNKCQLGPKPNDYAYCGCGREKTCEKKKKYDGYRARIKTNNLEGLVSMLLEIDCYLAKCADAREHIKMLTKRIAKTYGDDILQTVKKELYPDSSDVV